MKIKYTAWFKTENGMPKLVHGEIDEDEFNEWVKTKESEGEEQAYIDGCICTFKYAEVESFEP